MNECEIRRAHWRMIGLFWLFLLGSAVTGGLGMGVVFLFDRFAPDERGWHILGLVLAIPFFLSSLAANVMGLIVVAKDILHSFGIEIFSRLGQTARVKSA